MSVIVQGEYVTLTDGATVATDASLGETFYVTGSRTARTMSNPTNPTTGQELTYQIQNLGGALTTTWGTAFKLTGAFTEPAADRAKSITFVYNGTNWLEVNRAGANLKLISFDPGELSSLVAWYDANSIALADADPVASWTPRYGSALVQTASSKKPLYKTNIQNGGPVVRFDGTDDYMTVVNPLLGATSWSVFAVFAKADATTATDRTLVDINGTGVNGSIWFEATSTSGGRVQYSYGTGSALTDVHVLSVNTAFHQWSVVDTNTSAGKLYEDGGTAVTGASNASHTVSQANMRVGAQASATAQRFGQIDLAELIVYSAALNDTDRGNVQAYLKAKWGTP